MASSVIPTRLRDRVVLPPRLSARACAADSGGLRHGVLYVAQRQGAAKRARSGFSRPRGRPQTDCHGPRHGAYTDRVQT